MTHDEFVAKLNELNSNIEILSKYTGRNNPIVCKCLTCGHIWTKNEARSLFYKTAGNGCPECSKRKRTKTHEQFALELKNAGFDIELLSKYTSDEDLIKCRCPRCGRIWDTKAHNLSLAAKRKTGNGCIVCKADAMSQKLKKTHEQFALDIKNADIDIELLSEYTGDENLIKCRCLKCGNVWETTAHNLARTAKRRTGNGCKNCKNGAMSQLFRMSEEDVINDFKTLRPDIEIISHYTGDKNPLRCKCKNCGYIWTCTRRDLINGRNCPNCYGHSGTSYVEQVISLAFETVLPEDAIEHRSKELIGKELDIYIPSLHLAIEPGSWYFHKIRVDKDREKQMLCSAKGVRLIILYDNCNLNEPPFKTDCFITENDLSRYDNTDYLKLFVMEIMDSVGLDYSLFLETFETIKVLAKDRSKRRGTKQFKDELYKLNPNIEVIGEYVRRHEPIKCRCKVCEYEWEPSAHALLNGTGCPNCAGTRHRTNDEFVSKMKVINPTIEICGKYVNSKTHIDCRCTVCGCEWSPIPSSLLRGLGCPECGRKKQSLSLTLSQDEVNSRLHAINQNIELVGAYVNSSTPIRCRCKICSNEWEILFSNLSEKSCCPKCAKKQYADDLIKKIQEKNPNIELVSSYVDSSTPLKCRCRICGYEWESVPSKMLKRAVCSECKRKCRVDEALKLLKDVNPDVELLSIPRIVTSPVKCKCKICDHEWETTLYRLLKGAKCAVCAYRKTGRYQTLSHKIVVERLRVINPTIEIIGTFVSTTKHIYCKCKVCGHEWSPVVNSLLSGRGCPECGRIRTHKAKCKAVKCIETGVVYSSLEEAEEKTGICSGNIGSCCSGKRKRAGKLHWEFVE